MAKKNWDRIRNQSALDTAKYRDVYEDQQLERGSLAEKQTMFGRNILNGIICAMIFAAIWVGVSSYDMYFTPTEHEMSSNPEWIYIHCNEHYKNVNDPSDKISVEAYNELLALYDPSLPDIDEPVKPDVSANILPFGAGVDVYALDTHMTEDEYNAWKDEQLSKYDSDMSYYKAYMARKTDPKTVYVNQKEHYRLISDTNVIILPDEYNRLVTEYQNKLTAGQLSADEADIPKQPVNPAGLWKTGETTTDGNGESIALTYVNVFDGSVISSTDYDLLVMEFETDKAVYNDAFLKHRQKFHPGRVDENAKYLDWSPTGTKFIIGLLVAGTTFAILYSVFKKNLKAQNMLSDTGDINQYKNDQHVALPEEVQRNYDWFPDAGAHSAVQVSSMISHMAILNKGLKNVDLADRAKSDIINEDGSVEYYKGEILKDENGKPITKSVPIIDEQFMEDLFEASGAPKVKEVRHRYDTTKIPYNPDGSNRDKLGKYNTVADLINDDWEFPVYEPQRPGGAYIVDTAPVNTMVLAITRAGKGQTVIEPTLDMWMREKRQNNMVVNDPKGELLVKNYVRATVRGMQVVQFNLINAMKTDIYNRVSRSVLKRCSVAI